MPEIDLAKYETIPPVDLEARRREIVMTAQGNHANLSIDLLHELAAITGVLRRKASGPPKAAKTPRARKEKAGPATLDDLA